MSFVHELLGDVSIPESERQAALNRIYHGPGVPDPNGTTSSFWLKVPHPELHSIQSEILPDTADVVIIGSGITGTSVARTLLTDEAAAGSNARIVLLEAREICSGATGRNGGHCLESVEDYLALKNQWGTDTARRITKFRLKHLDALLAVAEAYGIVEEAQARKVQFLSAHFDDESWTTARESIEAFQNDMAEDATEWEIVEGSAEIEKLLLPGAVGIIKGPAGALWPYKFVTSILANLRREYKERFTIETDTPVLHVIKENHLYQVMTPRGTIKSRHVVHCTNGHAAHLLPELLGRVYPVRGQMSAQVPPQDLPNQGYAHSWLFNKDHGFDYLTQLPVIEGLCDGEMMLGGGFINSTFNGVRDVGVSRDDALDKDVGDHLEGALSKAFSTSDRHQINATRAMWTGIMGFSADGLPWVGEIPEATTSEGRQWVAAGFSGEGMVHTWLSGEALGQMLLEFEHARLGSATRNLTEWFPKEMMITKERIQMSKLTSESLREKDETANGHSTALSANTTTTARL